MNHGYSSIEVSLEAGDGLEGYQTKIENRPRYSSCRLIFFSLVAVISISISFYYQFLGQLKLFDGISMTIPFESIIHPMVPSSYWGTVVAPYPTGAFWTNLVVDNGEGQINSPASVLPYGVGATVAGVQVSYGATRRVVTQLAITDAFAVDMQLGSIETVENWSVSKYDNLSVAMQFNTENGGGFTNYLVKSSPYVTVQYDNATPVISSDVMLFSSVEGQLVDGKIGTFYIITLGNAQNWLLYCSVPVSFTLRGNSLIAPAPISGVVRIAFLPGQNLMPSFSMLAEYVECYPTSAEVSITYNSDVTATVSFTYITEGPGQLLMLALPHHMDVIALPKDDDSADLLSTYSPVYSMKGQMTPIVGKTWNLIYDLLSPSWNYVVQEELSISQLNSIAFALQLDVNSSLPDATDPYDFGKQIARLARLACIADYLGIPDSKSVAISNLEEALTPWLLATNSDPLVYDLTYGGIVSSQGIENSANDYGNGWYNDHHFHYGYFVYAFAALARFDPGYLTQYRSAMDSIMRDICTTTSTDPNFPFARYPEPDIVSNPN